MVNVLFSQLQCKNAFLNSQSCKTSAFYWSLDLMFKERGKVIVDHARKEVTCDQALFWFRLVKHSGGKAKCKIEPDTILLRNVYRPLFWLIDIQRNSQSKFLLLARSSVCQFPITATRKKSRKCRQNKKIIGYDISSRHKHSNLHDC